MATMRAVSIIEGQDGPTLEVISAPRPEPGEGQILIQVVAAGLNRADLRRTQAHFAVDGPVIAGLEVSGRVAALGPGVTGYAIGEGVAAMAPGGYADFAIADEAATLKVPQGVSFDAAAALAVWYQTAHDALISAGRFTPGDTVLITAAKSGVGLATAQCAKALGAGRVIGTVRSEDPRLADAGFDAVLSGEPGTLADQVMTQTGGHGADVTIDMVGAGLVPALMDAAALGGRIVSVGRMGGFNDTVDFDKLALRRLSLIGVTFRTRTRDQKRAVRDAMLRDLSPHLSSGRIAPVIDRAFPLHKALAAQDYMRANQHFGKVILTTGSEE